MNAPPGGLVVPGVQPGLSQGILIGRYVIVFGDTGGVFIYNGPPANGDLVASMAPPGTATDLFGNTVLPIITMYGYGSGAGKYINLTISTSSGTSGDPILDIGSGTSDEALPGRLISVVANAGLANQELQLDIEGPVNTNREDKAGLILVSSPDDLSGSAGGNFYYRTAAGAETNVGEWGLGGFLINEPFDGNQYDVARHRFLATGNQSFTSTSGVAFSWLSGIQVAAQTYAIEARFYCANQIAAVSDLINIFQGTATYGNISLFLEYSSLPTTNPPPSNLVFSQLFETATNFITPGFGIGNGYLLKISGTIEFATAGTWGAVGATSAAGDTWDMFFGSYLDLMPVTAV